MQIEIKIKRQERANSQSYYETYLYDGDGRLTVADYLTNLNLNLDRKTVEGNISSPVVWECSCLEKKCGACAMRINGVPKLACSEFLSDVSHKGKLIIEPLSKFPVVCDLKVDRSFMFEFLKKMNLYLGERSWTEYDWDKEAQYQVGQCLMCGCCLEACPNFLPNGLFGGAATMIQAYKTMEQQTNDEHLKTMQRQYEKYFHKGCGQALSCKKVCPIKLPLDDLQARANAKGRK